MTKRLVVITRGEARRAFLFDSSYVFIDELDPDGEVVATATKAQRWTPCDESVWDKGLHEFSRLERKHGRCYELA